ncbi:hypothetical protein CEXT_321041 [Caerostris extrusa]|uniref:Receptor L-domain domain-containing protein n=1 Tax=Caerostris extrusa TaxID=172846 RepID=A0AAV4NRF0_CAEEX|nr:hypothetical protein CEXT_321041 [Caerostris extrusa]
MLIQWLWVFGHPTSSYCVVTETNETVSELRNGSDFKKFNETLFQGKTFYTINYHEDSLLPRGFLRGLNVTGLIVNDTDFQGLEEKAFEGNVPDLRFIGDSVTSIWFQNSRLASFWKVPNLQDLAIAQNHLILQQLHRGTSLRTHSRAREGVKVFGIFLQPADAPSPDLFKPWDETS